MAKKSWYLLYLQRKFSKREQDTAVPSKNVFNYTICIVIRSPAYTQMNMSFLLYRTRECLTSQLLTSLPYTPSWRAEGQLQVIFAHFNCWRFKYQVGLCRSPLSAKKITFRKRKKGKHHIFSDVEDYTQKSRFPLDVLFGTQLNVLSGTWGVVMNEYVVIYLPFSQHPRLFRSARFRMWIHTKSEKSSQDAIILAVGNLDSRIWRHPT